MSSALSSFQDSFALALFAEVADETGQPAFADAHPELAALAKQPGFSIYRNTALKGCIDALQANYPAVLRLVGEQWFRAAAALYVRAQPPDDSRMLMFGQSFEAFIDAFPHAAELPYLPGVAHIDRFWTESHCAADAPVLEPVWISTRSPETLADAVLQPHPAARWCWFSDQPIYSIWHANRQAAAPQDELVWKGEGVLITRPQGTVIWTGLQAGGCAFLDACAAGQGLEVASAAAARAEPDIDFAQLVATLLQAGALTHPQPDPHPDPQHPLPGLQHE